MNKLLVEGILTQEQSGRISLQLLFDGELIANLSIICDHILKTDQHRCIFPP